jgi:hypothetical protein
MNRKVLLLVLMSGYVNIHSAEGGERPLTRKPIHSGYTDILGGGDLTVGMLAAGALAGLKAFFSTTPAPTLAQPILPAKEDAPTPEPDKGTPAVVAQEDPQTSRSAGGRRAVAREEISPRVSTVTEVPAIEITWTDEELKAQTLEMIAYVVEVKKTNASVTLTVEGKALVLKNNRTQQEVRWTFPDSKDRDKNLGKFSEAFNQFLRETKPVERDQHMWRLAQYTNRLHNNKGDLDELETYTISLLASLPQVPPAIKVTPSSEDLQHKTLEMIKYVLKVKKGKAPVTVDIRGGMLVFTNNETRETIVWEFSDSAQRDENLAKIETAFNELGKATDPEIIGDCVWRLAQYVNRLNGNTFELDVLEKTTLGFLVSYLNLEVATEAPSTADDGEVGKRTPIAAPVSLTILDSSAFDMRSVLVKALRERKLLDEASSPMIPRLFFYDSTQNRLLMMKEGAGEALFCWTCKTLGEEDQAAVRLLAEILTRYLLIPEKEEAALFTKYMRWVDSHRNVSAHPLAGINPVPMTLQDEVTLLGEGFSPHTPVSCASDSPVMPLETLGVSASPVPRKKKQLQVRFELPQSESEVAEILSPVLVTVIPEERENLSQKQAPEARKKSDKANAVGDLYKVIKQLLGDDEGGVVASDLLDTYLSGRLLARVVDPVREGKEGMGEVPLLQFGTDEEGAFMPIPGLNSPDTVARVCSAWNKVVAAYQKADESSI